jgi:chromosome segregation ATPase
MQDEIEKQKRRLEALKLQLAELDAERERIQKQVQAHHR